MGGLVVVYLISGFMALVQRDLKRCIAYVSVLHITSVFVLFCSDFSCGRGFNFLMLLGHRITSALLFILAGVVYYQRGTRRLILNFRAFIKMGGVVFIGVLGLLLVNLGVPPTIGFIFEAGLVFMFLFCSKLASVALVGVFLLRILILIKVFIAGGLGAKEQQEKFNSLRIINIF